VERRSAAQLPDAEKVRQADYVIYNTGLLDETRRQADAVFARLRREAERKSKAGS
jgi:dephospho-CoA kinase